MILSNKIAYFASPLDNCGTSYRVNSSLKLVPIKLEFNFTLQPSLKNLPHRNNP